jgi:hypothetical protein
VLWLRLFVTSLLFHRSEFGFGPVCVRLVVDGVTLEEVFLQMLWFCPVTFIIPVLQTLIAFIVHKQLHQMKCLSHCHAIYCFLLFPLSDFQESGRSESHSANLYALSEDHFKCPHERLIPHNWTVQIIFGRIILCKGNCYIMLISLHIKNLKA